MRCICLFGKCEARLAKIYLLSHINCKLARGRSWYLDLLSYSQGVATAGSSTCLIWQRLYTGCLSYWNLSSHD